MRSTAIKRVYSDFRGVDFLNEPAMVTPMRSPDAKNVWKDYEESLGACIETRPGYKKLAQIGTKINGLYFYSATKVIVHSGTGLYVWSNFPDEPQEELTPIFNEMNGTGRSVFNRFNGKLYMNDGKNYLVYDGTLRNVKEDAFIPRTTMGRKPAGGGTMYQDVNVLQPKRINSFIGDGTAKEYFLDAVLIDQEVVTVTVDEVNKIEGTDFDVNRALGKITFKVAPPKPALGNDNVFITFSKTVAGYEDRIAKCTKAIIFDNRLFYTGNPAYPNAVFYSELNNPAYISDLNYYEDGASDSRIKDLVVGSNVLWVFKDLDQNNANVFYHELGFDSETGVNYPAHQGNVSTGCFSCGINFKDDIVYLSREGMEGISTTNLESKQMIAHRSSLIDSKMINDGDYWDAQMAQWKGYLLVLIKDKVFLADSRQTFASGSSFEYEWYYWHFPNVSINVVKEYEGNLYLGADDGSIFIVEGTSDNEKLIDSYWTTAMDNFGYTNQLKTTNKRGGIVKIKTIANGIIKVAKKTNKMNEYEYVNQKSLNGFDFRTLDFSNFSFTTTNQSYLVIKVKEKKINEISLKFYSDELDKRFGVYSATLEVFVGGYIKK